MMANEFTSVPDHCSKEIEKPEGKYRLEALLLRGSFRFLQADRQGAMADFQAVIDDANAPKEVCTAQKCSIHNNILNDLKHAL